MTYAIISDIHAHAWTLFSHTDPDGVNSRLRITLNEMQRAAKVLLAEQQPHHTPRIFVAGDVFHARGTIDPEVLNPTRDAVAAILDMGISIYAIPGNHDLKSQDTTALSSAIQNLSQLSESGAAFKIFNKSTYIGWNDYGNFGFVPWRSTNAALLDDLEKLSKRPQAKNMDVFIHAGIEGVLPDTPKSGLTDNILGAFGFRHVFAGHYHHHKVMQHGVISIGATTHQTWSDLGSKAGFLLVNEHNGDVVFHDTHAPKFVDLSGMDEMDMELACDGNYVRFRGPEMTQNDINELRDQLKKWKALGISIEVPRTAVSARSGTAHKSGLTLSQSISQFVDASTVIAPAVDREKVKLRALEVLATSQAVIDDA